MIFPQKIPRLVRCVGKHVLLAQFGSNNKILGPFYVRFFADCRSVPAARAAPEASINSAQQNGMAAQKKRVLSVPGA